MQPEFDQILFTRVSVPHISTRQSVISETALKSRTQMNHRQFDYSKNWQTRIFLREHRYHIVLCWFVPFTWQLQTCTCLLHLAHYDYISSTRQFPHPLKSARIRQFVVKTHNMVVVRERSSYKSFIVDLHDACSVSKNSSTWYFARGCWE